MNYRLIFKLLGVILATLSATFLFCLGVAFLHDDDMREEGTWLAWVVCALISFGLAGSSFYLGRNARRSMLKKEGLSTIGLGWLVATVIGALPFFFIVPNCALEDAIFESASGLTTTGASVFGDLDGLPPSLNFFRCMSQWIGGMGVVVFFVALLSFLGVGGKILYSNEASAQSTELDAARVQEGVLQILYLYLALSAACLLALRLAGMSWFDAICHMFTTVSTGGFSPHSASIGYFSQSGDYNAPLLEAILIVFMALGGTSFLVIIAAVRVSWKRLFRSTEVIFYYGMLVGASLLLFGVRVTTGNHPDDWFPMLRESTFQVVSLMTTTGYVNDDYQQWVPSTHVLLLFLMMVGGCSGSTSGGAKVARIVVALKSSRNQVERAFRPRVVRPIRLNGIPLPQEDEDSVKSYLVLLAILTLSGMVIFAMLEHTMSLEGQFAAVFACLFNIGPGFAEVGPAENFGFLSPLSKLLLSLLMIMGRLELYAILALFSPALWRRFR